MRVGSCVRLTGAVTRMYRNADREDTTSASGIVESQRLRTSYWRMRLLSCCVAPVVCLGMGNGEDLASGYTLHILGPYALVRRGSHVGESAPRPALVRAHNGGHSGILTEIQSYAVAGHSIVGKCVHGYFVFRAGDNQAKLFSTLADWKDELERCGISENIHLSNPELVASTRPASELHPAEYLVMRGRLGLSDATWGTLFCLATAALWLLLGFCFSNHAFLACFAAALTGLIIGFLVWTFCVSKEPPMTVCGWPLVTPILCIYCAASGVKIRRARDKKKRAQQIREVDRGT